VRRRSRENPSETVWVLLGITAAVGVGVGVYFLTKPKQPVGDILAAQNSGGLTPSQLSTFQ
jgi:hypothetical protein